MSCADEVPRWAERCSPCWPARWVRRCSCGRCVARDCPRGTAELFGAFLTNKSTRAQAATVTASLDPALTLRAADAIQRFDKPVAVVWGTEDKLFPFSDAERLARDFPRATLITIPHSLAYVMIDAPQEQPAHRRHRGGVMTGNNSWDVTTNLGTTALGVAAQRAAETAQNDPLFRDEFAAVLVAAVEEPGWQMMASGDLS